MFIFFCMDTSVGCWPKGHLCKERVEQALGTERHVSFVLPALSDFVPTEQFSVEQFEVSPMAYGVFSSSEKTAHTSAAITIGSFALEKMAANGDYFLDMKVSTPCRDRRVLTRSSPLKSFRI